MPNQKKKNLVFEAEYLSVSGLHTDYIVTESEGLAREYAEKEAKACGATLARFARCAPNEIKHGKNFSTVEL
jgi:hypothetical protein